MAQINPQFGQYLSGLIDGDGTFSFSLNKEWNCSFKLRASPRNARLLQYVKSQLQCGQLKCGANAAEYRCTDRKKFREIIVPLFHQYPLYTTKAFYFLRWCQALEILENRCWDHKSRDQMLSALQRKQPPAQYRSPAWAGDGPSKGWICGFVEAEGSFKLVGGITGLVHTFACTQKLDGHCLEFLRKHFHFPARVLLERTGVYKLESSNFRRCAPLYPYFLHQFHGLKSRELSIWGRSLKKRGHVLSLQRVQWQQRRLRRKKKGSR